MTWSWALDEEQRQGMTRPQFARYYLMRLGIGDELKRVASNPQFQYRLASVEEVLALKPELRPPEKRKNFSSEKEEPRHTGWRG